MTDPDRPSELPGSYEEGVKMMEQVLDSRRASGAVSRQELPLNAPIAFGESSTPVVLSTSNPSNLRVSNSGKKETGGKSGATSTASSSAAPTAAGSGAADAGQAKKSKNQLKKETKGESMAKFWEEVRLGIRPDPRIEREKRWAQEDAAKASAGVAPTGGKKGNKGQAQPSGKKSGATPATGEKPGAKVPVAKSTPAAVATSSNATSSAASSARATGAKQLMQTNLQFDDPKRKASAKKKQILPRVQTPRTLDLFSHMPQPETYTGTVSDSILLRGHANIPAPFVKFGLLLSSNQIQGSNARNLALIDAFMSYLETFTPAANKPFHVDLDNRMRPLVQYIVDSRALSVGQASIIDFLKEKAAGVGADASITTTEDARAALIRHLKTFKDIHIIAADLAIQEKVSSKIQDDDVILTFGRSFIVSKSLVLAAASGKKFKVIVLDTKPRYEGVRALQELADHGIQLEYAYLNAISYVMKGVTKVLIGASAMMGNGQLYSRAGTSIVCMMAHTYRVPVLVACETYKFCEKVQLDSITRNEVDDPDLLSKPNLEGHNALKNWKTQPKLKMLNLVYDLTPSEFIDMIITEHGPVPPTSVPALIREFHTTI